MNKHCMLTVVLLLCSVSNIFAHEIETRHGAVNKTVEKPSLEGGYTMTYQSVNSHQIHSELLASLDLLSTVPLGSGKLTIYAEGSTTAKTNAVSNILPTANGDAGSALDSNAEGRLQISELHYTWTLPSGYLYTGLIDPAGLLDSSEIANDETRQFIGTSFINNPSIHFPDYTLATAWHITRKPSLPGLLLFLGSSHGLADNSKASYAQLFDINAPGKGVFAAIELDFALLDRSIRPGIWLNTADHEQLDNSSNRTSNYGFYTSIDSQIGKNAQWNLRFGMANKDVSAVSAFIATALEYPVKDGVWGIGIARSWASPQLTNVQSRYKMQAEVYYRFTVAAGFELTPSIQWLHNSDFNPSNSIIDSNILVATLRLTWPL